MIRPVIKLVDLEMRRQFVKLLYDMGYRFAGKASFELAWERFLSDGGDTTETNPYVYIITRADKTLTMYGVYPPKEHILTNSPRQFVSYLNRL